MTPSNPVESTDAQAEAELFVDSILPRTGMLKVFAAEAGQEQFAIRLPTYIVDADVVQAERGRRSESDEYRIVDLERLELEAGEYDVVLFINVVEHVRKPISLLPMVTQGLKHDGLFVLMLPNVLSLKGIVTRVMPRRFHQWLYVHLLRAPHQTQPVSSVHSLSLRASSSKAHAVSNGLKVEYFRLYEGPTQKGVRSRLGIVGWRWRCVTAFIRLTSFGLITAEETGVLAVFSKLPV